MLERGELLKRFLTCRLALTNGDVARHPELRPGCRAVAGGEEAVAEAVVRVRRVWVVRDVPPEDPDRDVRHLVRLEHAITVVVHLLLGELVREAEGSRAAYEAIL